MKPDIRAVRPLPNSRVDLVEPDPRVGLLQVGDQEGILFLGVDRGQEASFGSALGGGVHPVDGAVVTVVEQVAEG